MTDRFTYVIDSNDFTIEVWDNELVREGNPPFLHQPFNPANENLPWTSFEEAETWVKNYIAARLAAPVEEPAEE